MSNPRVRKIADRIKVLVAELLERRVKDPRLGFVTITDVRVTGDTQHATVYYTVLGAPGGDGADLEGTAAALTSARGMLRSEVGKQLNMRQVPTLEFVHDGLPESARQMEDLLERVRRSDEETAQAHAGATYAGEPDPYRKPREDDDEPDGLDDTDRP